MSARLPMPSTLDANPTHADAQIEAKPTHRATPLRARGEPMVWLTGAALSICAMMVAGLLLLVILSGIGAFWPKAIHLVVYRTGEIDGDKPAVRTIMGIETARESYDASADERQEIAKAQAAGTLSPDSLDASGRPIRVQFRSDNKDITGQPFVWVPMHRIDRRETPPDAFMLERTQWGPWFGTLESVVTTRVVEPSQGAVAEETKPLNVTSISGGVVNEHIKREAFTVDGKTMMREIATVNAKDNPAWVAEEFQRRSTAMRGQMDKAEHARTVKIGENNAQTEALRLRVRQAEIDLARAKDAVRNGGSPLPVWLWYASLAGVAAGLIGVLALNRTRDAAAASALHGASSARRAAWVGCGFLIVASLAFAWYERPDAPSRATAETVARLESRLARVKSDAQTQNAALQQQYQGVMAEIAKIEAADASERVIFRDSTTGRFAPQRQTEPDEPLRVSQVVRAIQPNTMGFFDKLDVFLSRWTEFIFSNPRESNTEGGIFPVIFGTVMLTMLLSILVVPLGVVAAIYLREYAPQGKITSAVRIAINNLAGVPSIVYGVFGLGFFCYALGKYVDGGPGVNAANAVNVAGISAAAAVWWWIGVLVLGGVVIGAIVLGAKSRPVPGQQQSAAQKRLAMFGGVSWLAVAGVTIALFSTTPYFHGFFESHAPGHKFGTKGILWSALTLALLTLPVVIVATEEAIAAVPRSMREGSYGCGASKWQTIQRIVLPRAMPGIMTGMILAMARGAGEVAPLMLVGAVKLAPDLPVSTDAPFVHLDRPFMHLGFHIYDVGFQSPDAEAARPLVWCTTFLLIVVVVALNATAIRVRSNLRRRFFGEAF